MRALLAAALLTVAAALAGCSSADSSYVCKAGPGAGRTIDLATVPGSGADGFDPESACPQPVPPSVKLTLPGTVTAFKPITAEWSISNGTYAHGHSMLSVLKGSHHAIGNGTAKIEDYVFEYKKVEHQDVPGTFTAKLTFTEPRTVWVRAFANVRGDGLEERTFASPEFKLTVGPVPATGTTVQLDVPQGFPVAAKLESSSSVVLGDALVVKNGDAAPHTLAFKSVPTGFTKPADQTLDGGASSAALLLNVPGAYVLTVGSPAGAAALAQDVTVNVPEPA